MTTTPVKIAVTGAAGNIGYSLVFRIAAGAVFGPDTPVELRLLEVTPALPALGGVVMELQDCAFPLLAGVRTGDDPRDVFDGADAALLVGAMPRKAGMDRSDLLAANGAIFAAQGEALNDVAAPSVRILVTGNPANTNALIAQRHAPGIPARNIHALTRLDHNRARAMLAAHAGVPVTDVAGLAVWGNHDDSMYPDVYHATIGGKPALDVVGEPWVRDEYIPAVATRGSAVIAARGASSAASAANATIDHLRDWWNGAADIVSMAVPSDGSYGVPEGLVCSFPCRATGGDYAIVPGIEHGDFSRARIAASVARLQAERDAVHVLGLI